MGCEGACATVDLVHARDDDQCCGYHHVDSDRVGGVDGDGGVDVRVLADVRFRERFPRTNWNRFCCGDSGPTVDGVCSSAAVNESSMWQVVLKNGNRDLNLNAESIKKMTKRWLFRPKTQWSLGLFFTWSEK